MLISKSPFTCENKIMFNCHFRSQANKFNLMVVKDLLTKRKRDIYDTMSILCGQLNH